MQKGKHDEQKAPPSEMKSALGPEVAAFKERLVPFRETIDRAQGHSLVIFLGLTGVGKSTMVNYLQGLPMVLGEEGTVDVKAGSTSVTKIGHDEFYSQTLCPETVPCCPDVSAGRAFSAWSDFPGFDDSRGAEENTLAQICSQLAVQKSKDVSAIVLCVEYDSFKSHRMDAIRKVIRILEKVIGDFRTVMPELIVVVTKKKKGHSRKRAKEELLKLFRKVKTSYDKRLMSVKDEKDEKKVIDNTASLVSLISIYDMNLIIADPLDHGESRHEILSAIQRVVIKKSFSKASLNLLNQGSDHYRQLRTVLLEIGSTGYELIRAVDHERGRKERVGKEIKTCQTILAEIAQLSSLQGKKAFMERSIIQERQRIVELQGDEKKLDARSAGCRTKLAEYDTSVLDVADSITKEAKSSKAAWVVTAAIGGTPAAAAEALRGKNKNQFSQFLAGGAAEAGHAVHQVIERISDVFTDSFIASEAERTIEYKGPHDQVRFRGWQSGLVFSQMEEVHDRKQLLDEDPSSSPERGYYKAIFKPRVYRHSKVTLEFMRSKNLIPVNMVTIRHLKAELAALESNHTELRTEIETRQKTLAQVERELAELSRPGRQSQLARGASHPVESLLTLTQAQLEAAQAKLALIETALAEKMAQIELCRADFEFLFGFREISDVLGSRWDGSLKLFMNRYPGFRPQAHKPPSALAAVVAQAPADAAASTPALAVAASSSAASSSSSSSLFSGPTRVLTSASSSLSSSSGSSSSASFFSHEIEHKKTGGSVAQLLKSLNRLVDSLYPAEDAETRDLRIYYLAQIEDYHDVPGRVFVPADLLNLQKLYQELQQQEQQRFDLDCS